MDAQLLHFSDEKFDGVICISDLIRASLALKGEKTRLRKCARKALLCLLSFVTEKPLDGFVLKSDLCILNSHRAERLTRQPHNPTAAEKRHLSSKVPPLFFTPSP